MALRPSATRTSACFQLACGEKNHHVVEKRKAAGSEPLRMSRQIQLAAENARLKVGLLDIPDRRSARRFSSDQQERTRPPPHRPKRWSAAIPRKRCPRPLPKSSSGVLLSGPRQGHNVWAVRIKVLNSKRSRSRPGLRRLEHNRDRALPTSGNTGRTGVAADLEIAAHRNAANS